jgi:hypothetical protein
MGYKFIRKRAKFIAYLLLLNIFLSVVQPLSAYALTSGPSQPENQSFQPVGTSDMVDLASGDFKYNIPLMDVDGYPLNLSYASGVGIEDEASWVGLGWNLNVGSINRQLRGVPDDFNGDEMVTTHYTKPKITVGGRVTAKVEAFGKAKIGGSFSFGIFSDNYTGIGAELGVNAGMSFSLANSGILTSSMGIGVLSNTSSGVDVTPNVSLSISELSKYKGTVNASLSSSLGYNSRSGLKSLTLGQSFAGHQLSLSMLSYNTEPIMPKVQIPYYSEYDSFSFDVGGVAWGVFGGIGGTGYLSKRSALKKVNVNQQYGFLYADQGKDKNNVVQDFIREKENPIINELPNLAIPVHTPDIFSYNSQTGSGQFRLYRGGTGIYSDNEVSDISKMESVGFDVGIGAYAHGGVTKFDQNTVNTTRKWTNENRYLKNGDFQSASKEHPLYEHVYFRKVDEKSLEDDALRTKKFGTNTLAVKIDGKTANTAFASNANSLLGNVADPIIKKQRGARSTSISYLTAKEASKAGLDRSIKTYRFVDSATFDALFLANEAPINTSRTADFRKEHHISEITVTGTGSERMVYGIPVYNKVQEEYSFALGNRPKNQDYNIVKNNLVSLKPGAGTIDYKKGIDHYFHKESQAAYASSYLLTGVLSPDYVDRTGDGISDDDLGTGMKFKYSRLDSGARWRTPYASRDAQDGPLTKTATLNRGLLADPDDDKGSFIYGEKEIYYVQSIESKTQIAYFITADRLDGLGVDNWQGGRNITNRQKVLKEIRLYSKADRTKPIKTVKFSYNYKLCQGTPNSIGKMKDTRDDEGVSNGKLTLERVWFEYGNSPKGIEHPYIFTYNNKDGDVKYNTMYTDRWGIYKDPIGNPGGLTNEEYPYTLQNKAQADLNAALYHLNRIDLPTGGTIKVNYESDDYAYVQNKRAAVMTRVVSLIDDNKARLSPLSGLIDAKGLEIQLDSVPPSFGNAADSLNWFKNTYLSGSDYMFSRFNVKIGTDNKLSNGLDWDFISTYCKIRSVEFSSNTAYIFFELIHESNVSANPIVFSAWQKMKNEYPRYAYPGFMNRVGDENSTAKAAVTAVVNAAKNLTELKQNFYVKAKDRRYAKEIDINKSFVRISKTSGKKIGGGVRVKKISIDDNWKDFTGDPGSLNGVYGQSYEYTTTENGNEISSGVASYEPAVGNEENPLKQPVPYIQKIKGAINNYFELEEPFGESFFPAATVVYSKVTVKDLNANGVEDPSPQTGSIVNEFYTAKNFPVRVSILPIQRYNPNPSNSYTLIKTNSYQEMTLSQGYSIELNDMPGKPKAVRVLNKAGAEISSTVYRYAVENEHANELRLDNKVAVVDVSGTVTKDVYLGRDIEFFTDFREQESKNTGTAINIGVDVIPGIFGIPFPIPHWPVNGNNEYKLFRSACAVKVIQSYGMIKEVLKTENGSSISVENIAYDGLTGEAVVTRTQNEFNKNLYTTNIPAYWAYPKMGGAYNNIGILIKDIPLNSFYEIQTPLNAVFVEGDELADINSGARYWIIKRSRNTEGEVNLFPFFLIINEEGKMMKSMPGSTYKIVRSAYRNQLSSSAGSIVSLINPIQQNKLNLLSSDGTASDLKVINASATLYDDEWALKPVCSTGPRILENNNHCFNFGWGDNYSGYSSAGANIQQSDVTLAAHVVSEYWGGVACGSTQGPETSLRMAKKNSDTTFAVKNKGAISAALASPIYTGPCTLSDGLSDGTSYSCWPLNRSGIWLKIPTYDNLDEWIGFEKCINFPSSKTYYFGFAADNLIKVYVDDIAVPKWTLATDVGSNFESWTVKPLYLSAGKHMVRVEFCNRYNPGVSQTTNYGAAGLEIYNQTYQQLINHGPYWDDSEIIFSTKELRGKNVQSFRTLTNQPSSNFTYHYTYEDGSKVDECTPPEQPFNPYFNGFRGNWRVSESAVYQGSRTYDKIFEAGKRGVRIDDSGFINGFRPYWVSAASRLTHPIEPDKQRWITANTITLYDKYGQELENRDALNRYSAAKFDFNGELPGAVASNARNREIFAESFEDGATLLEQYCNIREFVAESGSRLVTYNTVAHTGNYSALLPTSGVTLSTVLHTSEHKRAVNQYLGWTQNGEYKLLDVPGLYPNGFEPVPNGKYLFSAWVKDGQKNRDVNVTLTKKQGASVNEVSLSCKAVVEGWKLMQGTIEIGGGSSDLALKLWAKRENVFIDDIRIHPVNGHMKSYAYNNRTLKLMAELDENCFSTFYEYDDSGSLIRVKKETERGIITIKENRSSYRKKI